MAYYIFKDYSNNTLFVNLFVNLICYLNKSCGDFCYIRYIIECVLSHTSIATTLQWNFLNCKCLIIQH